MKQSHSHTNLVALVLILVFFSSCDPIRLIFHNRPTIDDLKVFPHDTLPLSEKPFKFQEGLKKPLPKMEKWLPESFWTEYSSVEEFLIKTNTTAFLVIRNDSILYENYFNGYFINKPSIVFSVSKAVTTALLGIALEEGHIKSLDQKIVEFIPAFAVDERRNITLRHLSQMTSGLNFEDNKTILKLAKAYYNRNVEDYVKKLKLKHQPGTHFAYKSIDTQILSFCLEKAIGRKISDYLNEKLWSKLDPEFNTFVTLDRKKGNARMYGGLAVCARDLAKFGRLFLNNGSWNGEQIIPQDWTLQSSTVLKADQGWWGYSTGWWINDALIDGNLYEQTDFAAIGYSGQYVYVNPESNMIIVRQGKGRKGVKWMKAAARLSRLMNTCGNSNYCTSANDETFEGIYRNKEGKRLKVIRKEEDKWLLRSPNLGRLLRGTKMGRESIQSLFNEKKRRRLIMELDSEDAIGLYFDNFRKINYYKKESPLKRKVKGK